MSTRPFFTKDSLPQEKSDSLPSRYQRRNIEQWESLEAVIDFFGWGYDD